MEEEEEDGGGGGEREESHGARVEETVTETYDTCQMRKQATKRSEREEEQRYSKNRERGQTSEITKKDKTTKIGRAHV